MSNSAFDFKDLLQLVELIKSSSQFNEFKLHANGIQLELRRGQSVEQQPYASPSATASPAVPATAISESEPAPASTAPPARPAPPSPLESGPAALGGAAVTAPMVGTVYLAPEPGAAPFVRVGQRVEADTQVCIVEVMKLMNTIQAGRAGVVEQVLVADADAVEYGQPLFVIRAD